VNFEILTPRIVETVIGAEENVFVASRPAGVELTSWKNIVLPRITVEACVDKGRACGNGHRSAIADSVIVDKDAAPVDMDLGAVYCADNGREK